MLENNNHPTPNPTLNLQNSVRKRTEEQEEKVKK